MLVSWYRSVVGWSDFDAGCKRARISGFFVVRGIKFTSLNKSAQIHPSMAVFRVKVEKMLRKAPLCLKPDHMVEFLLGLLSLKLMISHKKSTSSFSTLWIASQSTSCFTPLTIFSTSGTT